MAVKGIYRAGLASLRVLNLEESIVHYRDRVGLDYVGEFNGGAMLKGYDEFDHHSVYLHEADAPGLDYMCFKADSEEYVDYVIERTAADFGWPVTIYEAGELQPGFGRVAMFDMPTGHKIGIYATVEQSQIAPMVNNPQIWREEPHGMGVTHFDHALRFGPNQSEAVKWFLDVLEFKITEILYKEGDEEHLCTWMTTSTRGHDIALLDFPEPGVLHHISFHLPDWNAIGHAADIMGRYGIQFETNPMRHGITRGQTIYFFDPSGNRNEVFAGGYAFMPDMQIRVWDSDHAGEGVFYYDKVLNDRFLSVYTK